MISPSFTNVTFGSPSAARALRTGYSPSKLLDGLGGASLLSPRRGISGTKDRQSRPELDALLKGDMICLQTAQLLGRDSTGPRSADTHNRDWQLAGDFVAASAGRPNFSYRTRHGVSRAGWGSLGMHWDLHVPPVGNAEYIYRSRARAWRGHRFLHGERPRNSEGSAQPISPPNEHSRQHSVSAILGQELRLCGSSARS